MSLSNTEKRTEHWHVKIKPSIRKSALLFIVENDIKDQSEFTEQAISFYISEQGKRIESNVEMK